MSYGLEHNNAEHEKPEHVNMTIILYGFFHWKTEIVKTVYVFLPFIIKVNF